MNDKEPEAAQPDLSAAAKRTKSHDRVEDLAGIAFGRWKMVRVDDLNIALYKRGGDKGRGAWGASPTYHGDAGYALRHAARQDANDAIKSSATAADLVAAWDALADRVDAAAARLARRTVPKPDPGEKEGM